MSDRFVSIVASSLPFGQRVIYNGENKINDVMSHNDVIDLFSSPDVQQSEAAAPVGHVRNAHAHKPRSGAGFAGVGNQAVAAERRAVTSATAGHVDGGLETKRCAAQVFEFPGAKVFMFPSFRHLQILKKTKRQISPGLLKCLKIRFFRNLHGILDILFSSI